MSGVALNWLKSPAPRDVIARWTRPDSGTGHLLDLPQPPDPERWTFLALGDTGDSEPAKSGRSPQDAVAAELAREAALPGSEGAGHLVLHLGDVVYMAGERRLYDRNFRRPYADFLTPESTVDDLVFRLPFLPVPGNHDYYDMARWAETLARTPLVGAGLRAVARELFAFSIAQGGSGAGRAFMEAFVGPRRGTRELPPYVPGVATRLPNRYYRFSIGSVDFFALDSNTLESPPPAQPSGAVRAAARSRLQELEVRAAALDAELRRRELNLERWQTEERSRLVASPERVVEVLRLAHEVDRAQAELAGRLQAGELPAPSCAEARSRVATAAQEWSEGLRTLEATVEPAETAARLALLDRSRGRACTALQAVESCLGGLPEGPGRATLLTAREGLVRALDRWRQCVAPEPPGDLCTRIRQLSEAALDAQRELAREKQRSHYRPADYDQTQLEWLARSLEESLARNPGGWRVVFLHHPLYTTIGNHCEKGDVRAVRENLFPLLRGRVHLVLTGHSHGFEWIRSRRLPETGIFVTGGGGQVALRRSIMDPRILSRHAARYAAFLRAGAQSLATAGKGPAGRRGERGMVYHFLRFEVSPDVLRVVPVGVRRLADGMYRREEPLPVYWTGELPPVPGAWAAGWERRELRYVEIRRGQEPAAGWSE